MNKSELIDAIAASAEISKTDAGKAVDSFVDAVTNALVKRESVSLIGFGTFSTKDRAARVGRNPQTGESLQIKAATLPHFKAGKGLKEAVNN